MEQKWIDNLRKQSGDYTRKAPEGLLDDIKKEMSRRGIAVPTGQPTGTSTELHASPQTVRRQLTVAWTKRIAAVAAAAVLAFIVVTNWNSSDMATSPLAGGASKVRQQSGGGSIAPTQYADNNIPAGNGNNSEGSLMGHINNVIETAFTTVATAIHDDVPQFIADILPSTDNDADKNQNVTLVAEGSTGNQQTQSQPGKSTPTTRKPSHWFSDGQPQNFAYNGNGSASGLDISAGYAGMGGSSSMSGFSALDGVMSNNPTEGSGAVIVREAVTDMTTDAHHDMPVKLGVSLRYRANKRWSLQTGVNYSYLLSDITKSNNVEEYDYKQKLHYVSVPLTASYSVWQNKNVNVYVSGGAEAAKLVSGRAKGQHRTYSTNVSQPTSRSVSEHRLQYSVSGAAGIEYKADDRLSVYAEPGVTHYFNNHSGVVNIYKDKPTQFTINVGLRLNINK